MNRPYDRIDDMRQFMERRNRLAAQGETRGFNDRPQYIPAGEYVSDTDSPDVIAALRRETAVFGGKLPSVLSDCVSVVDAEPVDHTRQAEEPIEQPA